MRTNILMLTDSYKLSHYKQYPSGTTQIYSYFESRGGWFDEVVFFGLQYILKNYLAGAVVTQEKIDEAERFYSQHFGTPDLFYKEGWEYILKVHQGHLPVRIKAVPEGTPITTHNVMMTVENTDPNCYWLTNFLETLLLQVWYPCTVATLSREVKKVILKALETTGTPESIDFKLHDFGFRGASSVETAGLGGAAHLVNFMGTDTVVALSLIQEYYNTSSMMGFSIPASEHSTITSWGREHELDAYANMLQKYPKGLVAVVSDSYDIFNACEALWGTALKEQILEREGTLVIRPDSGDPKTIDLEVLELLGKTLGYTLNAKGYKVLHPNVRIIQGDGVNYESIQEVLTHLEQHGWSADNIAFGMGGALLQKVDRDTQKFAFKCSCATVNGEDRDVFKDPITDQGKQSKKGRLKLVHSDTTYTTRRLNEEGTDLLIPVFENGVLLNPSTFEAIKKRAQL